MKLYHDDCIKVMRNEIADESIDLIVTDPPYLIEYKTNYRKYEHDFDTAIQNDNNPQLIIDYIKECYRILKSDSAMYIFCSFDKVDFFKQELEKYFNIKNMIIWVKNNWTAGDLEAQFGKQYNITRERVRQIEAKAIRKIRLPQRIVYLTEGKKVLELKQDISKLKVELNNIKRELLNQIKKPELIELNEDERILLDNNQPISILDLSVRTHNALLRSGINTVGKLLQCSYLDLCRVRNMGNKSRKEIIEKLKGEGLKLKGEN